LNDSKYFFGVLEGRLALQVFWRSFEDCRHDCKIETITLILVAG
jgi:hypothetical protein